MQILLEGLATVSVDGLVPTSSPNGCNTCQQFLQLYDAMQAAEEDYATYKDRRDDYSPKKDAFAVLKRTSLDFNNWLLNVEAFGEETEGAPSDAVTQEIEDTTAEMGTERGTKRVRSSSSCLEGCGSMEVPTTRKRLRFSDTVEFHEEYRLSSCFLRSDEAYVPGRYAPPEDIEYLDTSGSGTTAVKFLGMKKVGKTWVEVDVEKDGAKSKEKGRRKSVLAEVEDGGTNDAIARVDEKEEGPEDASTNAREQRFARRQKANPVTPKSIGARPRNGGAAGKVKSTSQNEDKARQPLGTPTVVPGDVKEQKLQFTEAAVDGEGKGDGISDMHTDGRDTARDVLPSLQVTAVGTLPDDFKESTNLLKNTANHESNRHHDIDEQVHLSPEDTTVEDNQGSPIERLNGAASKLLDHVKANAGIEEGLSASAHVTDLKHILAVRHQHGSVTADEQEPALSKGTLNGSHDEETKDGIIEILRDNANTAADDTPALEVDRQTLESTMHDLETVSWSTPAKIPSIREVELQDYTSAAASAHQPRISRPNPSPEVLPLNNAVAPQPQAMHNMLTLLYGLPRQARPSRC